MKRTVKVIYLDLDGYVAFEKELHEKRIPDRPFNTEWAVRTFKKAYKHNVDGIEYYTVECHPDFWGRDAWPIAEKYGFSIIQELEWINI